MGPPKKKIKVNIEFGGQGGSSGCLGIGFFKMLFRGTNTFFCGGGCLKIWWLLRCATLSDSVAFVQAFRFAGANASHASEWRRRWRRRLHHPQQRQRQLQQQQQQQHELQQQQGQQQQQKQQPQ